MSCPRARSVGEGEDSADHCRAMAGASLFDEDDLSDEALLAALDHKSTESEVVLYIVELVTVDSHA